MLHPHTVTTREITRNYKAIFARVQQTKQPTVVLSQKKPQVAIVSLEDLEELKRVRGCQSVKTLRSLAGLIPKGSGLPVDLSVKHNEYTWD